MTVARQVLVLFAHPAREKSLFNVKMAAAVRDLPGVTFHDLYEAYPEFDIDVPREQALLEEHDAIVWQHPFYWYSVPALLREWQDLVLQHGWAYGSRGTALRGKLLLSALTAGGHAETYCHAGDNRFTVRELLAPLAQTGALCGMRYLPPFVVFGTHAMGADGAPAAARRYRAVIEALRDDRLDLDAAAADGCLLERSLDGLRLEE